MTSQIRLRCYCHGLGDCMLLRLGEEGDPFWILIDCGVHTSAPGGPDNVRAAVADIVECTRTEAYPHGHLHVIVGTHEHMDHLSGFLQAAPAFDKMQVDEIWFSWAENPADKGAAKLDRYKGDVGAALASASLHMSGLAGMEGLNDGLKQLLGFVFGAEGDRVRTARERLRRLGTTVRFLEPGKLAPLPQALGLKAYVLGPPRDEKLLGIEDIVSETYALGGTSLSAAPFANALNIADGLLRVDDDPGAPFDGSAGLPLSEFLAGKWLRPSPSGGAAPTTREVAERARCADFFWNHYLCDRPNGGRELPNGQEWRRIDNDWLASSVELALQVDGRTNNTSLVLAFEAVATGKVFLFAADAQVGSWLSWPEVVFPAEPGQTAVTGEDLIRRTVFYKVGHHGSRNATVSSLLEKMDRSQLTAFSSTDTDVARDKAKWKDFPSMKTAARIRELTSGRFIESDADWIRQGLPPATPIAKGGSLLDIRLGLNSGAQQVVGPYNRHVDLTLG